jgi:site-specific recombinase XerD
MLNHFFSYCPSLERIREAPYQEYIRNLAEDLWEKGYNRRVGQIYLRFAAKFLTWAHEEKVPLNELGENDVANFLCKPMEATYDARQINSPISDSARAGTRHMLRIIQEKHPEAQSHCPATPAQTSLAAFRDHLRKQCGYSDSTIKNRISCIQGFLERFFGDGALDVLRLTPTQVMADVTEYANQHNPQSTSHLATSLRSYFRFLQFHGLHVAPLFSGIPRIAQKRRFSAREMLTEEQTKALLSSFELSKAKDMRDYAMALCMLDLGMRSCDVARLVLEDIDWNESVIRIPDVKTRRPYHLPLPIRLGRAISGYLRKGRPQTQFREIFLRHMTPVKNLEPRSVQSAMHNAYVRAGLPERWHGCHLLRRTAATRMHRQGIPLKEIADILGHQSIDTTIRYTRLDPEELAKVALPWQGGRP